MGKTRYILLLVFMWLWLSRLAAGADIGFGAVVLSADTLHPADTLLISTSLINYGPQDFDGPVGFDYAINGVQNISRSIFDAPLTGQNIHIQAGGSYPLQFHVVLQNQYFSAGSDIFVVWPIVPNGNVVIDTLQAPIYIAAPTGITNSNDSTALTEARQLRISCSAEMLTMYCPPWAEGSVMHIYDITGKQVQTAQLNNGRQLSFYNEAPGIYLIEISSSNGRNYVLRVIKH